MPKRLSTLFKLVILFIAPFTVIGQECSIHFTFGHSPNKKVYLAHYYNGSVLINDSTMADSNGIGKFEKAERLTEGIYKLYIDQQTQFDFLLGNEQDLSFLENSGKITVSGSKESVLFNQYRQFMASQKEAQKTYIKSKSRPEQLPDSVKKCNELLERLDNETQAYWQKESKKLKGSFYARFMKSNIINRPEDIPLEIENSDSLLWLYEYNFMQNHYWDNFDLADSCMWFTPTVKTRLDNYFNKVILQQADTVLKQSYKLINQVEENPMAYKNLLSYLLNNSFKSEFMGIENVFIGLAKNYYLNGKADWATPETLDKIRMEVYYRQNNLIGHQAKELVLEDTEGNYHSLHQIETPYTLLVFWEPGCGHCKKEIPQLYDEVFLKANPSQLSFFAVYTQTDKDEWQKFINEHQLNDWVNVWDPTHTSQFHILYNVRTTPMIYLLDNEKKIVAKNMSVENTIRILKDLKVTFKE